MPAVLVQVSIAQPMRYLMNKSKDKGFANGDAVIATEGSMEVTGVVSEVYDDVVEIEFFDAEIGDMDSMEFHESFVEAVM